MLKEERPHTTLAAGRRMQDSSPPPQGSEARNLPPGKIGKLLIFKSGKVKLRMGDVLLDVSAGLPIQHRQDVGAGNWVGACEGGRGGLVDQRGRGCWERGLGLVRGVVGDSWMLGTGLGLVRELWGTLVGSPTTTG